MKRPRGPEGAWLFTPQSQYGIHPRGAPRGHEALGAMAVIALLLSALGIWGIIEYAVSQATRGIGLRMALGARPRVVLIEVLRQALQLVSRGLLIGAAALWPLPLRLQALPFGISPHDPVTIALSSVLLPLVALVAAAGPSSRAVRIDRATALRTD